MRMRKILSTLFLAASLSAGLPTGLVLAQDGPAAGHHRGGHGRHGRFRRGHRLRRMGEALNLTDAQRAEMRALREQMRGEDGARLDRGARRALFEQMRGVLTPEQQAQMAEMRQQRGAARMDHRIERMTERLSLDARQAQQVRGILTHAAQQRRALMEQARLDETSPREAMRAIRERTDASIRSVLTDEQQATLDAMRAERGERGGRGFGRGGFGRGGHGHGGFHGGGR